MTQRIRISGPIHGAWPEVKDGLYTGKYRHFVKDGDTVIKVSKSEWKQALPAKEAKS